MSSDATGHNLVLQTTGTSIERQALVAAGQAANRAAANYLFADYRQRRAESTLRTQRAALVLWVQYLVAVGAAGELLAEAQDWALAHLGDEELEELAEYAAVRQTSLPNYIWRHILPVPTGRLARRDLGAGRRACQVAAE